MNIMPRFENESEMNVLGTIIKNNDLMNTAITKIKPDDFYSTKHKIIYNAMCELYKNDISFDEMILYSNISKRNKEVTRTDLFELSTCSFVQTYESHVNNLLEASKQRSLLQLQKIISNEKINSSKKIELIENELYKIGSSKDGDRIMSANDVFESSIIRIEKAFKTKGGFTGVKTGVGVIDTMLNGLQKKDMIVFGARPSCGKTAFSLKLIQNMNANCLYIQLDMGLDEIGFRMMATDSRISNMKVARGIMNDNEWEKLSYSFTKLANKNNLFFYSPSEATVTDIKSKAKELKIKKGLDVIIIDHIGKITPETSGSAYEQMKIISKKLKSMFRELDVAGIVLCQLSRAVEQRQNKRPIMSDLRDSGSIEEDKII